MKPQSVTAGSATFSRWVALNHRNSNFTAALGFSISSGGSLTAKVQHTFDDVHATQVRSFTRSTTVCTIPITAHGLSASDYVFIEGAGSPFDGEYAVASVVDADNITVTVSNSGATVGSGRVGTARVFDHDTMTGMTSRGSGNYFASPMACRLLITSYTSGVATLTVVERG